MEKKTAGRAAGAALKAALVCLPVLTFAAGRASVAGGAEDVAERAGEAVDLYRDCERILGRRCGRDPHPECLGVVRGNCQRVALGICGEQVRADAR